MTLWFSRLACSMFELLAILYTVKSVGGINLLQITLEMLFANFILNVDHMVIALLCAWNFYAELKF